jgi:hypothetical protein
MRARRTQPSRRRRPAPASRPTLLGALLGGLLLTWAPAGAQVVPPGETEVQDPAPRDPALDAPITPSGAFVRSLLVPGWGHLVTGAPSRGAFYMAAQSSTAWMIWKSSVRRRSALRYRRLELGAAEAEVRRTGVASPDSIRFLAEQSERVERMDELVDRRGQQVEDWVALGIFLALLGATDAFVSAHLADFPEPLSVELHPGRGGQGWEVGIRLPLGRRRSP